MNTALLLKAAPLLLAASLALGVAGAAQAQNFTFTAPTTSSLTVRPGDIIPFSGTLHNDQLEQIDDIIIVMGTPNTGGKFTFTSRFFHNLAVGQTLDFTGTLKISSTATFTPTFFVLVANGVGHDSPNSPDYNLTSDPFKVTLAAPVPEASAPVSLGLLLAGLVLVAVRARKRRTANV